MKLQILYLVIILNIYKGCRSQIYSCQYDTMSIFLSLPYSHDDRFRINEKEFKRLDCTDDFYYITHYTCMGDSYLEEYTSDTVLIAKGNFKPIYIKTIYNRLERHTDKYGNIKDTIPKVYVYSLEKTGIWYYYDRTGKLISTINHVAKKVSKREFRKRYKRYLRNLKKTCPDYCKKHPNLCN